MDTKLKNISFHWSIKLLAFLAAAIVLCTACVRIHDYIVKDFDRDYSSYIESVITKDYTLSDCFRQDVIHQTWRTLEVLHNDSSQSWEQLNENLPAYVYYWVQAGDQVYTNYPTVDEAAFSTIKNIMTVENGLVTAVNGDIPGSLVANEYGFGSTATTNALGQVVNTKLHVGLAPQYIEARQAEWDAARASLLGFGQELLIYLAIYLVILGYLIWGAGRKAGRAGVGSQSVDKLWTEIPLFALGFCLVCFVLGFGNLIQEMLWYGMGSHSQMVLFQVSFCALTVGAFAICLFLFLSLVRKLKTHSFFKGSFIYWLWMQLVKLCKWIQNFFLQFNKKEFDQQPFTQAVFKLQRNYIIVSMLCVFFFGLFFVVFFPFAVLFLLAEVWFTYCFLRKSNKLTQSMAELMIQINQVEQGNLDYKPNIEAGAPLYPYSVKLTEISNGLKNAVEKQMRDERTKIELVTNVSHDLKTPLTSIISYIDLLKGEELNAASADYVSILSQKAERLKSIVSDLFELAKSTSGNLELQQEIIDLKKLVEQTTGDMEDRIAACALTLKVNLPENPVLVQSDGRRMSRVLQNLLDNALKYSLSGSRIYIDLSAGDGTAMLAMKNTAAYEMTFTASDILERFSRGDKMRTTEGSGLGLSIAQSFTEVCGGKFAVAIDGDQFKVTISFPLSGETAPHAASPIAAGVLFTDDGNLTIKTVTEPEATQVVAAVEGEIVQIEEELNDLLDDSSPNNTPLM